LNEPKQMQFDGIHVQLKFEAGASVASQAGAV
jgi:hypothetical protein